MPNRPASAGLPGRLLAPLALALCVVAVIVVVNNTLGNDASTSSSSGAKTNTVKQAGGTGGAQTTAAKARKTTYTVKPGDVLSSIAERTGVSVADLVRLNPGVDPQSLRAGQKLKLR
jgi:LysM repeat protein